MMKSSQYIIFNWLYTVLLLTLFFVFMTPMTSFWIIWYKGAMFLMFLILPMFLKFFIDDIEDEYNEMWWQLRRHGRIL